MKPYSLSFNPPMEKLGFRILKEAIFSTFKLIFFEFLLIQTNRDWENPYNVHSERFKNEDAPKLEEVIKNMDINPQFSMNEVEERIRDGHLFYVAKKIDNIIGNI